MVALKYNREHNYEPKQYQIAQITMSCFVENADFVTIHAKFRHLVQNDIEKFIKVYYNNT